ncbi:MAG: VOC family protein [Pseudomonadales bacterium]|nr:VOC family protein [Pseudomonadales bacterium]NRA18336.1 VOC family protein [Oceanospirillaceae bacterium]
MGYELDHFFILLENPEKAAQLLESQGLKQSFSRVHPGQGTSNICFEFSNSKLELLWLRDADEANDGPGRDLRLCERATNHKASPFGLVLNKTDSATVQAPFAGWVYQADYLPPGKIFHIAENSANIVEPLCIYLPFMQPPVRTIQNGKLQAITQVHITVPADVISGALKSAAAADRLSIATGKQHLMEVTFDTHQSALIKDFRPELPLIIYG